MKCQVGVDVSKKKLAVAAMVCGVVLLLKEFDNNKAGFKKLLAALLELGYSELVFACEATGVYHESFARAIHAAGYKIAVINPRFIKHEAEAMGIKSNTDISDAQVIAHRIAREQDRFWEPAPKIIDELNDLILRREQLKTNINREESRLERYSEKSTAWKSTKRLIRFMEKELEEIEKQIDTLKKTDKEVEQKIDLAKSLPGIGRIVSVAFIARVGDVDCFYNGGELVSFLGMCPRQKISGSSVNKSFLSRRGDAILRKYLYMAALTAIRVNSIFGDYFDSLISRGVCPKKARVAVMRKLVLVLYAVLRDGIPFSNERYGLNKN